MSMDLRSTEDGRFILEELMKQAKGQLDIEGNEEENPEQLVY